MDAGLVTAVIVADAAVPCDQLEAELSEVTGLDLAHLARHEVIVEELHLARRF